MPTWGRCRSRGRWTRAPTSSSPAAASTAVTLGVLLHEFSWAADDYDRLAAGSLAGHIIECGCQEAVAHRLGRMSRLGQHRLSRSSNAHEDGNFIVTKPPRPAGSSPATVGEQLLYEIGDPASYLLPDVTDFRQVRMEQAGLHRVLVTGPAGAHPGTYKVSATAAVGFKVSAQLTIVGIDAAAKAAHRRGAARAGRRLLRESGAEDFLATHVELLGTESAYGPHARPLPTREVVLRLTVTHADRQSLEMFSREFATRHLLVAGHNRRGRPRGGARAAASPFSFRRAGDADGHDRRRDLRGAAAASQTAGRAATAGERRRRGPPGRARPCRSYRSRGGAAATRATSTSA